MRRRCTAPRGRRGAHRVRGARVSNGCVETKVAVIEIVADGEQCSRWEANVLAQKRRSFDCEARFYMALWRLVLRISTIVICRSGQQLLCSGGPASAHLYA